MRRKLLNVHIPDLAHLAENVCQTELMKNEKEKHKSEQRSKSKPFTRKEKVAYMTMESSEDELDFETEVDSAKLKKGPPYTCPKEIPSPAKMEKGKAIAQSLGVDKSKEVDVEEEYFEEEDDDMIGMISIIPTEYLGEYEGDTEKDYDMEDEEAFSFI
ncbi:hypothetical protein Ahy_A06g029489 [Arachis hypogaea]|uniref:Uncharacterized protein n=1 Tax=Arachis hypogaea TaxID=3818 RepID=A0A445CTJ0_ARAHY|nr:hypothetical protein Ahy_A06g029489 [Arachis hypogaea]